MKITDFTLRDPTPNSDPETSDLLKEIATLIGKQPSSRSLAHVSVAIDRSEAIQIESKRSHLWSIATSLCDIFREIADRIPDSTPVNGDNLINFTMTCPDYPDSPLSKCGLSLDAMMCIPDFLDYTYDHDADNPESFRYYLYNLALGFSCFSPSLASKGDPCGPTPPAFMCGVHTDDDFTLRLLSESFAAYTVFRRIINTGVGLKIVQFLGETDIPSITSVLNNLDNAAPSSRTMKILISSDGAPNTTPFNRLDRDPGYYSNTLNDIISFGLVRLRMMLSNSRKFDTA